jgi:hypothetical protein
VSELFWSVVKANVTEAGREHEEPLNEWWSYEHVPEFVARPGFRRAWRLRTIDHASQRGDPGQKYLAVYEVESIQAFSDSLAASQPPWGPWQDFVDDWLVDWSRTHYRVLHSHDQDDAEGSYWAIVRASLDFTGQDHEREFDEWYTHKHVPEICGQPGIHRAWRLQVEPHWDVVDPAPHRFWGVYQVDAPESFAAARERRTASGIEPWDGIWLPYLRDWRISYHELMYEVAHEEATEIVARLAARS